MLKVLIVDDFYPDRLTLHDILASFSDLHLEVVDTCEDGVQALDAVGQSKPDIVISDIEMPFMSGLELCKRVKEKFPNTKFLFCSVYSEFEYARRAIYLESGGYILKPIDPQELHDALKRLITQIQTESQLAMEYDELRDVVRANHPILKREFLKDLLCGFIRDENEINEKMLFFGLAFTTSVYVLLIEIDIPESASAFIENDAPHNSYKAEFRCVVSAKIQALVGQTINDDPAFHLIVLDDQHLALLYGPHCEQSQAETTWIFSKIVKTIHESAMPYESTFGFALSGPGRSVSGIYDLYRQCQYIMKYRYLFDTNNMITANDVPTTAFPYADYNEIQSQIKFYLNANTRDEISEYFDRLFTQNSIQNDEQTFKNFCFFLVVCIQCALTEGGSTFEAIFEDEGLPYAKLMRFSTIFNAKNFITNIALSAKDHLAAKSSSKQQSIVEHVERYVLDHDLHDISLESIAADLHYNSVYLNYVYKQQRGKTIFDYLLACKMEKAKALLAGTGLKLYEITEAIGYSHTSYFTSVFKKHVGLTPSEYRMRNGKEGKDD